MHEHDYEIRVSVEPSYLADQSAPDEERYVFAYTVTIRNTGEKGARLLTRHWIITDGNGKSQEVRGEGVVGEQPHLEPGQQYRYTSGTVSDTPVATMQGSYQMEADDGTRFEAAIPVFTLSMPHILH
ncbi:MAG TPA: Co2+/Mg2+ efflux protein ApaG [Gammaproteobacteria bacterium]